LGAQPEELVEGEPKALGHHQPTGRLPPEEREASQRDGVHGVALDIAPHDLAEVMGAAGVGADDGATAEDEPGCHGQPGHAGRLEHSHAAIRAAGRLECRVQGGRAAVHLPEDRAAGRTGVEDGSLVTRLTSQVQADGDTRIHGIISLRGGGSRSEEDPSPAQDHHQCA